MDYNISYPEKNTAIITAVIPADAWAKYMENAKEKSGFTEEDKIRDFAISTAASDIAMDAIAKDNLKLATAPAVAGEEKDGAMEMTLNCQLLPEVKLGAYKGLGFNPEAEPVKEEELLEEVNRRINADKLWTTLPADTPAKNGDRVIIDFKGLKDGVPFEGGTAQNYALVLGSGSFIPGFEEALVGMKAGEEKAIDIPFPADYFEKSLAGQPVVFEVTVHEVQEEIKPELTDAFFEKMGLDGAKTVDEFKEKVLSEMKGLKEQEAENKALMELLNKISDGTEIDIPASLIDNQVNQHLQQIENQMRQYGLTMEQYYGMTGVTMKELEEQLRPQAIYEVRQGLILEAIAEKEEIQAEQTEIQEEYALLSNMYGLPAAQLQAFIPVGAVAAQIVQRKTMDFLKENNK